MRTKLEKSNVQSLLMNYDIVGLNEVKTNERISLPGYVCYKGGVRTDGHRGGTVILVKRALQSSVMGIDFKMKDQVWVRLSLLSNVLLGFIYIPPTDSQYFNPNAFSYIQEKISSGEEENCNVLLIGDMNTRFGNGVRNILTDTVNLGFRQLSYPEIPDQINVPNENANTMSTLCVEHNLVVVNNLKYDENLFKSKLTYRKRNEWISEVDVCVASHKILDCIKDFFVCDDLDLPSDHAPIAVTVSPSAVDIVNLKVRACSLGDHSTLYLNCKKKSPLTRPIKFCSILKDTFIEKLSQSEIPQVEPSIDSAINQVTDIFYRNANASQYVAVAPPVDVTVSRWERLLSDTDDKRMWQAIDWRGEYKDESVNHDRNGCPSDEDFKLFYEEVYNPQHIEPIIPDDFNTNVNIPILDDDIRFDELLQETKKLKQDKACGPDGISPGIFKILPDQWINYIVTLLNAVFSSGSYPASWQLARMFMIFKKGNRSCPKNYRGINVINSLAKLYDMVLSTRLNMWFAPDREQAGSQRGRGCVEHIVSLRLLIDLAYRKKYKLFVCFVDFSMAYDRVPRSRLFHILKELGCGSRMLSALVAMYAVTLSVIGTSVLTSKIGVRQGSPTSCLLFILFVNQMIRLIKSNCGQDGFLQWLHLLVLMDDTVLLSTTRRGMKQKLTLLNEFCVNNGMVVNNMKTKFFVIHASAEDREPFRVGEMVVEWCDRYMYLGSMFTSIGTLKSAIAAHAQVKMCHILKFVSFLEKNRDIPFYVKKRMFDAALVSTILYGCESWFHGDLRPVEKLYNWGIKQLLGVRMTTCTDICYVELGYPTLKSLVLSKQRKFFQSLWSERSGMVDDPWAHTVRLTLATNTPTSKHIRGLIDNVVDDVKVDITRLKQSISDSVSSRRLAYKELNPTLTVHDIYMCRGKTNELHRMAFSRLRVIGHNLVIETGRWNRRGRGRLPVEERLCPCGAVQTELHVLELCPLTQHLRDQYSFNSWRQIINEDANFPVAEIVYKVISCFA